MKFTHIEHLFFDLDHTLWDYDRNSAHTLRQLYISHNLESLGLQPLQKFIDSFHKANLKVWDLFGENSLNRHHLRNKRLELVFEAFGLENQIIEGFHEEYYAICSKCTYLMEGAKDVLERLKPHFDLHIITNGFDDAQYDKLEYSGLSSFFSTVTTSEAAGSKKPEKEYFDYALNLAKAKKENSLVVGDGLRTDVVGAINSGIEVIWYNNSEKSCPQPNILEIKNLWELVGLLQPSPQN